MGGVQRAVASRRVPEIKEIQLDESDKEDAEEMDVSDEDDMVPPPRKKMRQSEYLKEENDSLRCQMEAYKNEVDLIKADLKSEVSIRDDQIDAFKKTLQGMQQTLSENAVRKRQDDAKTAELHAKVKKLKEQVGTGTEGGEEEAKEEADDLLSSLSTGPLSDKTARLIGLTSTFLHIHPKGASVDYIWSFIQQFDKEIRPSDIETMLNQYPTVYKQITTGVGACLERKWIFTGFETTV
ncbi:Ecto-NOX disulfide-thiol exchanger 1 [Chionoecetes opilio]|uniref:Ecto-NOX disulfide-thiol exchanger 1 n=1 Tax=Chionoecetes opilio TaxID=41210 RepID=A0A8J5D023_CHIOP|nr:Ecto-NOX disulfide-thiol exchanger 1 [Chionoecetes opilio]